MPSPSLLCLKSPWVWLGSALCCSEGWGGNGLVCLLGLGLAGGTRLGVACFRGSRGGFSGTRWTLPKLLTLSLLVGPGARPFFFF